MEAILNKYWFLKSRKFWTFLGSVMTILTTAATQHPYPTTTVILSIVSLAIAYMGSVAWEDTAKAHADAIKAAAEVAAKQPPAIVNVPPVVVQVPPVVVTVPGELIPDTA